MITVLDLLTKLVSIGSTNQCTEDSYPKHHRPAAVTLKILTTGIPNHTQLNGFIRKTSQDPSLSNNSLIGGKPPAENMNNCLISLELGIKQLSTA